MSLFERIRGGDEAIEKIAIWPFINYFTFVMDGEKTIADMAAEFELSADEQLELGAYLAGVGGQITAEVQRRILEGATQDTATKDARTYEFSRAWQALSRAERGYIDEARLKSDFGVS